MPTRQEARAARSPAPRSGASAYLRAVGCVSVHGSSLEAIRSARARLEAPPLRRAPESVLAIGQPEAGWIEPLPRPERWTGKPARLGRMDRLSHLALCAAELAVQRHGGLPSGGEERRGLVLGTAFGAHLPNELFWRGVREAGVKGASPAIFAYTLPSAAVGELAIHFALRGPGLTLAQGRGSGLAALAAAAALIEEGRAELVLAGAADSLGATLLARATAIPDARVPCEGAVFFVLASEPGPAPLGRIAGAAQARGAGARARAERSARERAGLGEDELRSLDGVHPALGDALAAGPLLELALALEAEGPVPEGRAATPPPRSPAAALPCLLTAIDAEAETVDALCVVEGSR